MIRLNDNDRINMVILISVLLASWGGVGSDLFGQRNQALKALILNIVGFGSWPFESGPLSFNGVLTWETGSDIIDANGSLLAGSGSVADDGDVGVSVGLKK